MPTATIRHLLTTVCAVVVASVGIGTVASAHPAGTTIVPNEPTPLAACPVLGASVYGDTWGDPRSGGRRHEGVDMEALRGTPVVAVQDGLAEFKQTSLGGNSIWLVTSTGERYFYAHLDAFEGASRAVGAGEVIGYVGQTGNARGDHLHFEVRLGETAVNPYPYVVTACTAPIDPPAAPPTPMNAAMRTATASTTTIPTWPGNVR